MTYPDDKPYPLTWDSQRKKPGSHYYRPGTLLETVMTEDKQALYNRRLTTRALAEKYSVKENTVSALFPGKAPHESRRASRSAKTLLLATRREYRKVVAEKVVKGELSLQAAAEQLHIHPRTMRRAIQP